MIKWNFPITRKLIAKYKELGFIKFVLWLTFIWIGVKILVINIIGVTFFDAEPFPLMRWLGIL